MGHGKILHKDFEAKKEFGGDHRSLTQAADGMVMPFTALGKMLCAGF